LAAASDTGLPQAQFGMLLTVARGRQWQIEEILKTIRVWEADEAIPEIKKQSEHQAKQPRACLTQTKEWK
jgi:hypothetical protein